ncbi:MAG TPA: hypothetical protein VKQ32_26660 [Polyangia bacterium]|nr:hypothetical protein [Polyangia bacterium]
MKTIRAYSLVAAAVLTGLAGCGSSGPTADSACADLAAKRCTQRSMCSALPGSNDPGASLVRTYGDMATCKSREALACRNGMAAKGTGNSPSKAESCVAAFGTYTCQDFFDNNPPAACAVTGTLANASPCTFNGQCQSGYCQGTKNSMCGACADSPAAGADCSTSTCGHNQRCVAQDQTCEDVVSMGGACDATHPCDNGLACFGDTATTMGTCEPAGTNVGAACGGGTMPGCDNTLGLYCAGATGSKTCAAITFVGDGMPCGLMSDGTRVGCKAGECFTATGVVGNSDMGTCKADVDAPNACDTMLGPRCLAPARCVTGGGNSGTCIIPTGTLCM